MYLSGHIRVTVNDQPVNYVSAVDMQNDAFHIGSSCDVIMPLNARLAFNNSPGTLSPGLPNYYTFNTGDHIKIWAKYDGYESHGDEGQWVRVFDGFIYDFFETTPLKIHCLDYIYWFNIGIYGANYVSTRKLTKTGKTKKGSVRGGIGKSWPSIEFTDLCQDIVNYVNGYIQYYNAENDTSIPYLTFINPGFSFELVKISFINMSPAAVLEWLKRELGFCITLMGTQLYANVASNTQNAVKLDTTMNVIESNLQSTNLQHRDTKKCTGANSVFLRIKLKAYFEKEDGTKDSIEIGDPNGKLFEVYFYKVAKGALVNYEGNLVPENYVKYANEALNACYLKRYQGEVETYLYPIVGLFDKVTYADLRYPERAGDYVCTAKQIKIDDHGYHQRLKLSFLTNYNILVAANA